MRNLSRRAFLSAVGGATGQIGGYNGEPRFSYQQAVDEVRKLAASVRESRPGIAG